MNGNSTALVSRVTVQELVRGRDKALAEFAAAHSALVEASEAIFKARKTLSDTAPGVSSYNHHLDAEKIRFHQTIEIPERDAYMATARRITDTDVWARVIALTELERLMDKKAKDLFRGQLLDDPPEVTVENIYATIETFAADAGTIFKRGIAECFSNLDRRFRSHDGWRIGSRIILTYAFSSYGSWNYHRNHQDSFADIERVFLTLDGKPIPPACQITQALNEARGWGPQQTFIETEYFKVRAYKNGNAHVWFKRDDLLVLVNRLLGEYYGAPIPEDRDPDADDGLDNIKTTPAKRYGFFPTPKTVADHVLEKLWLGRDKNQPRLRILEPSAGTGNLAKRCLAANADRITRSTSDDYRFDPIVDCVEIQPHLADALRAEGLYGKVYTADFLKLSAETTGQYDIILMNPPFDRERDIDHVMHALTFLKPGGRLVAIMSAGTEFRETRKSQAFRNLMKQMDAEWRDLPARSFSSVGTNCNTIFVSVRSKALPVQTSKEAA